MPDPVSALPEKFNQMPLEEKCIHTIRCLAMDAVQKANSGHPGTPMALAPAAYVLWTKLLRYNPQNPNWFNRDRFVLSNGHASMLQYALLYLTGYDLTLDELKNFRQWESKTPGHPEYGRTPGIETTTGPLGQGIMTAVGMALAETHLAALFNKKRKIVDHHTYVFCSDGDLMEGASQEAASVAGHLGLGKLICLYDNNHITIEGHTPLSWSDDVADRFKACHWQVQEIDDGGNDPRTIEKAFQAAKADTEHPSLIILRTHIGYGAPHKQDTPDAHGSPLGEEEISATKKFYGWPEDKKFFVPEVVLTAMRTAVERGAKLEAAWEHERQELRKTDPDLSRLFDRYLSQQLPDNWTADLPTFTPQDGPTATRAVNSVFLNAIADKLPWLIGGSGDLEPSTKTLIRSSAYIEKNAWENRNIAWGIREHVMCAASSGLALHGGIRPYAATFFIFTDYARPAIRLACIMKLPVIYVMTHDSIGLGEDGTTHQPIEHLASFRAMPNMFLIRPADANEALVAWRYAIKRTEGPTMLVLSRQKLPIFDRQKLSAAEGLEKGAYILHKEEGAQPDVQLIATGSEVQLVVAAQEQLKKEGIDARVISMPGWEIFRTQTDDYKTQVLDPRCPHRISVEAGATQGWKEWVGEEGAMIGIDHYGESAPEKALFSHFGFTVAHIVEKSRELLQR